MRKRITIVRDIFLPESERGKVRTPDMFDGVNDYLYDVLDAMREAKPRPTVEQALSAVAEQMLTDEIVSEKLGQAAHSSTSVEYDPEIITFTLTLTIRYGKDFQQSKRFKLATLKM